MKLYSSSCTSCSQTNEMEDKGTYATRQGWWTLGSRAECSPPGLSIWFLGFSLAKSYFPGFTPHQSYFAPSLCVCMTGKYRWTLIITPACLNGGLTGVCEPLSKVTYCVEVKSTCVSLLTFAWGPWRLPRRKRSPSTERSSQPFIKGNGYNIKVS